MKITGIKNRIIKLNQHSITIKNAEGKTAGVVTDVTRWADIPPRDSFTHLKAVKESGIWSNRMVDNVVIVDKKLYYLHDLNKIEFYENCIKPHIESGSDYYVNDTERYNKLIEIAENARKYMEVISCYIG